MEEGPEERKVLGVLGSQRGADLSGLHESISKMRGAALVVPGVLRLASSFSTLQTYGCGWGEWEGLSQPPHPHQGDKNESHCPLTTQQGVTRKCLDSYRTMYHAPPSSPPLLR